MRGGRKWAKPACGRPLDGRVRALRVGDHKLALVLGVHDEHTATGLEQTHSIDDVFLFCTLVRTRSAPTQQLTDCPAQHGGAKRQQPSDLAALPQRANARGMGEPNRLSGERDRA